MLSQWQRWGVRPRFRYDGADLQRETTVVLTEGVAYVPVPEAKPALERTVATGESSRWWCRRRSSRKKPVDLSVVNRIRQEALQNSKVMDHLFYLTDVYGPRLTNSPGFFSAADWVVKQLGEWGISAHQEKWGPFGRAGHSPRFSAHLIEPQYAPLVGFPLAYSPGTSGPVTGDAMIAVTQQRRDFANTKGRSRKNAAARHGA